MASRRSNKRRVNHHQLTVPHYNYIAMFDNHNLNNNAMFY